MEERPPLESFLKSVKSPIQQEDLESDEIEVKVIKGKRGEPGRPGKDADIDEVTKKTAPIVANNLKADTVFLQKIKGEPGNPGLSPEIDIVEITERVINLLPDQPDFPKAIPGQPGKDGSPDTPKVIIEKINKSRGEKIKRSRVEGLDEVEGIARGAARQVQNVISLGGSRQTIIQSNGQTISTGATTLNFINGTLAVPTGNDGSTINYTAPSSGGGSGFQAISSGSVNGSNTVFTWATAPNAIVVDNGRIMQKVSSDGTINWTGTTTTTLAIAPTFDIFGVA